MEPISADQLRAARGLLGLSQRDLAALSKVSRATIADFEAGKRQPYARTLADLQRAMESAGVAFVSDDELIGVRIRRSDLPSYSSAVVVAERPARLNLEAQSEKRAVLVRRSLERLAETGVTPEQVKAGRELLGWSQGELADRAGASETAIGLFEREKRRHLTVDTTRLRAVLESAGVEFAKAGEPSLKTKPKEPEIPLDEFLSQLESYEQNQLRPNGVSLGPKAGVKVGFALLYLDRSSASLMLEGKELGRVKWSDGTIDFEPPISESDLRPLREKLAQWAAAAYEQSLASSEPKPVQNVRQYVPKSDSQREPPRFVGPSWLKRGAPT